MFQRPVDYYAALDGERRAACAALLDRIGARAALETPIARRVARRSFRLVLDE